MKTIRLHCATARLATFILILSLTGLSLWAQLPPGARMVPQRLRSLTNNAAAAPAGTMTPLPSLPNFPALPSGSAVPGFTPTPAAMLNKAASENEVPAYDFTFTDVNSAQLLDEYALLVNRTLLRAANLPAADHIILVTKQKLTKSEAIQALEAVLALNGISVIPIGDKFVKVLPTSDAGTAGAELDNTPAENLPNLGTYVTHIVQLNYVKPSVMQGIISPLGKVKDIIPIDDNGILVIRDYAENVKRMLEMIAQIDVSSPQEYTNEVIEIKYALADDIANALNSLGGQGGASTVAIGTSTGTTPISGVANSRGGGGGTVGGTVGSSATFNGGGNNYNQPRTFGSQATTPGGETAGGRNGTGNTFQQRLQNIIQNAARPTGGGGNSQDQIQVFGQAKIIADARANSLLVFATRADMERIKAVVSKLDVLLAQVLIESAIMDVSLNKGWNFGVSVAQNPKTINGSNPKVTTAGGVNNGQSFLEFLNNNVNGITNATGVFGNSLPNGLSYFGNIGPTFDVAVQAAANDNSVTVIQRPRIQTSQAKPAQFFVGSTVPYITGTTYGTGINGGNSSSYSQLSVGVELDITPFINPDGLVVMDINQEIDDISGSTTIDGNAVPNTDKRTLSSEIAVRDKDTVMLGGFIRSGRTKSRQGIPLLQDIPLLGALFSSRSDSHDRQELIVLMRPTVLKTPELAAKNTLAEEQRLPGIMEASAENDKEEAKQVAVEERAAKQRAKVRRQNGAPFTPVPPPPQVDTNTAMPLP